jgi:hypothetical protein
MKQTSRDKVERPARSGFSSVYKTFTLDIGDGVSGPVRCVPDRRMSSPRHSRLKLH